MHQILHRMPRLLYTRIAQQHLISLMCPARWISHLRINILERDREVDDVELEIIDSPICELLAANGLNFVAFVEGVPELGDEEKFFAGDKTVFDGAGNAFPGFFFVTVI